MNLRLQSKLSEAKAAREKREQHDKINDAVLAASQLSGLANYISSDQMRHMIREVLEEVIDES